MPGRRQRREDRHRRVGAHEHLAEVRVGGEARLRAAGLHTFRTARAGKDRGPLARARAPGRSSRSATARRR